MRYVEEISQVLIIVFLLLRSDGTRSLNVFLLGHQGASSLYGIIFSRLLHICLGNILVSIGAFKGGLGLLGCPDGNIPRLPSPFKMRKLFLPFTALILNLAQYFSTSTLVLLGRNLDPFCQGLVHLFMQQQMRRHQSIGHPHQINQAIPMQRSVNQSHHKASVTPIHREARATCVDAAFAIRVHILRRGQPSVGNIRTIGPNFRRPTVQNVQSRLACPLSRYNQDRDHHYYQQLAAKSHLRPNQICFLTDTVLMRP